MHQAMSILPVLIPIVTRHANHTRRHLLRLWLRDPENAWMTPEPLQPRWDTVYKDVTEDEQAFPLEPALRKNVGS